MSRNLNVFSVAVDLPWVHATSTTQWVFLFKKHVTFTRSTLRDFVQVPGGLLDKIKNKKFDLNKNGLSKNAFWIFFGLKRKKEKKFLKDAEN